MLTYLMIYKFLSHLSIHFYMGSININEYVKEMDKKLFWKFIYWTYLTNEHEKSHEKEKIGNKSFWPLIF